MKTNAPPPLWTTTRRVLGNIVPAVLCLPFFGLGIRAFQKGGLNPTTILYFVLFVIVGWLGVNLFGFWGNRSMRNQLKARLGRSVALQSSPHFYVGVARPQYKSAWDPHEDVGFLVLADHELLFVGETLEISIPKESITGFRFRPNIHTAVGIGRWISLEGAVADSTIRLLIEPREKDFVVGNWFFGKELKQRLEHWLHPDKN